MDLTSTDIYEILTEKEVKGLYHANTVRTSKTFLENGGLLSRKYIEENGLIQTNQKSDELDKKYDIWGDIFVDAINISKYFTTYNKYGPILFGFSLDVLKNDKVKTVRITKKNPIYWKDEDTNEQRYFTTPDEFKSKFKSGNKLNDGGYHITIKTLDGLLSFDNLLGIQIDNPGHYFKDQDGFNKLITQGIIEFFTPKLQENSISLDNIFLKDDWTLKLQYRIMRQYREEEYRRLFHRRGE